MRAEAMIDLGRLREAGDQAALARTWYDREGSPGEVDILLDACADEVVAAAGLNDAARSHAALQRLLAVQLDSLAARRFVTVRSLALARAHTALRQYAQACAALDGDQEFESHQSIERFLHGMEPNWIWRELPRNALRAKCLLGTGQTAQARKRYDDLLALPGIDQNNGLTWQLLFDRGRIAEGDGDDTLALQRYRQGMAIVEQMRASIDTEASKIGFLADKQDLYGAAITLLARRGRADDTLEIMERAKARALVDLLAGRFGEAPAALDRGDVTLASALARQQDLENTLREQAPVDHERPTQDTRKALQGLNDSLRRTDPDLASLVSVEPVALQSLRSPLQPDEVAVEFHLVHDQLITVTTDRGMSRVHTLAAPGLPALIRQFRQAIIDGSAAARSLELGQHLYDLLFRPLEAEIGHRPLLLIPHAELNVLPFAALHDGHDYLGWRQSLRLGPSVSALRFLHHLDGHDAAATTLVIANPTLDLPGAAAEAQRVARLSGGARILAGHDASKAAFLGLAPDYARIHFAGHGHYDAERPLDSRLYFSRVGPDHGELRVGEVYGLHLKADMMTMSACESGLGRVAAGDEVIGLTRAFLYAGARSVVATLWEISDDATLALMEDFYRNLAAGMNKRDALRAAQHQVAGRFPEPFYWAAFFLAGAAD